MIFVDIVATLEVCKKNISVSVKSLADCSETQQLAILRVEPIPKNIQTLT